MSSPTQRKGNLAVKETSRQHFGIGVALFFGFVTAVAATVAVIAQGKRNAGVLSDLTDNWDDILGI
jgi:hypothetical protein